jgi:hypothetical protein
MKLATLCLAAAMFAASGPVFSARGQNPPPAQPDPAAQAAKLKDKWVKAFTDARRDFAINNDQESAEFAGKILAGLEQPGGLAPAALAAAAGNTKARVRDLVRRGALESAARLNWAQYLVLNQSGRGVEPAHPNHKTGGNPGPGGLVLYLPFDAPDTGGVVHDASGAGNDGQVQGATWVAGGKFGGAYHFSITNVDDRIVIPNSDLLNPDYITVSAWIKTDALDGFWSRILDKDWRKGYCLDLGGDENGKIHRGKLEFESPGAYMESDQRLADDRWHHVAATFDGRVVCQYIDGVAKSRTLPAPRRLSKCDWDLCIGNSVIDYGTGEFLAFDGLIDEVRIYNRALAAAEIKALAAATQGGIEIPAPPADTGAKPDAATRLKQVKTLFDQGLINKEDYDKKVKEIMDSL